MIQYMTKTHCFSLLLALMIVMMPGASRAQDGIVDILPPILEAEDSDLVSADQVTHAAIRLTPDKSELVRLEEEAGSIIIGNPIHINIIADSSKTIVVVPRVPGATHFTILGKKGQVLMQRHVIVASPKKDYIRVKRTCTEDAGEGCQSTSVFYCPDMCHEIGIAVPEDTSTQDDASSGDDTAGGSGDSTGDAEEE